MSGTVKINVSLQTLKTLKLGSFNRTFWSLLKETKEFHEQTVKLRIL